MEGVFCAGIGVLLCFVRERTGSGEGVVGVPDEV
jgi:hypothetical protein